jgi:hypothetical protein
LIKKIGWNGNKQWHGMVLETDKPLQENGFLSALLVFCQKLIFRKLISQKSGLSISGL